MQRFSQDLYEKNIIYFLKYGLKAVLFDLDGVITDTSQYHYKAWKRLADIEGIYFDEIINERLKGVSRTASLEIILELSSRNYSPEEREKLKEIKNSWYLEMIDGITPYRVYPKVTDLLKLLRNKGIKTAVCSASKSAGMIIEKLGITEYFDTIVGGNDVRKSKPDPEVFLIASGRLNACPENCLVLEDAYAGIDAAKRAGMKAAGIGSPAALANADVVFGSITDFYNEYLFLML